MHYKKALAAGAGFALVLAGASAAVLGGRGTGQRPVAAPAQHDAPHFETPCGGEQIDLASARRNAPFRLPMPKHPLASEQNLTAVWDCPGAAVLLEFSSGANVLVDVSTIRDPEAGWRKLAEERSGIYSTGRVKGVLASLTDPAADPTGEAEGGVTLVLGRLYIGVGGNGKIPLDNLVGVTESLE